MNILHLLNGDDKYGSAQCFLDILKREKNIKDVQITVITPFYNDINKYCDSQHINNYIVKYNSFLIPKHNIFLLFALKYFYYFVNYYKNKKNAINKLLEIVDKHHIDIIHTNSCVIDIGAEVSNIKNIPHVWHLREFGKEDFNFYPIRCNYIKFMNNFLNNFIAISDVVKNVWVKKGINKNKITTIYDGIDTKLFSDSDVNIKESKEIKVVMVGSFCEAKGQKKLLKAVSLLDDYDKRRIKVYFYGKKEGAYYNKLEEQIDKYNLRNFVEIKEYSNNIPVELKKYDVGVICSKSEAFGRVTVEYMMAGLCTLVPNSGANIEIVENNNCGIVYKSNDINDLVKSLRYILNNKNIIKKYCEIGKKVVKEKFDINKNYINIYNFFKKIEEENNYEDRYNNIS